jgi:two-component system chemotaxis response regulator CheB
MARIERDFVAVGGSAGSINVVGRLLELLPKSLPATVLVAIHRPTSHISRLQEILARRSQIPIIVAERGQRLHRGFCYIGEPSRHLALGPDLRAATVEDGFYRGHCVDILFNSVAQHAGAHAIGIVLSGMLKDGCVGLKAIKDAGGVALVQDPEEAEFNEMPRSAIRFNGPIDLIAPVERLAEAVVRLTAPA